MSEGNWVKRAGKGEAKPAMCVADTAGLKDILGSHNYFLNEQNKMLNSQGKKKRINSPYTLKALNDPTIQPPLRLLDFLSAQDEGKHRSTLFITHSVLQECLRIREKRGIDPVSLGLKAGLPPVLPELGSETFLQADSQLLWEFLSEKAVKHALRIYPDVEAAANAGEFKQAQGGVVIINDPFASDISEDGRYISQLYGRSQRGDKSICDLFERLKQVEPSKIHEKGIVLPVLTRDNHLESSIKEIERDTDPSILTPIAFRLNHLIGALSLNNLIDKAQYDVWKTSLTYGRRLQSWSGRSEEAQAWLKAIDAPSFKEEGRGK